MSCEAVEASADMSVNVIDRKIQIARKQFEDFDIALGNLRGAWTAVIV
jgi:hypothetical protein